MMNSGYNPGYPQPVPPRGGMYSPTGSGKGPISNGRTHLDAAVMASFRICRVIKFGAQQDGADKQTDYSRSFRDAPSDARAPQTKVESMDCHRTEPLLVAATMDDRISLIDTDNGNEREMYKTEKYGVACIKFTHHPSCVLYASTKRHTDARSAEDEHAIRYHSLFENSYIRYFKGHREKVTSISVSPCEDLFLTAGKGKEVLMWDLRREKNVATLEVNASLHNCVAIDKSSSIFAVGSDGGNMGLYDLRYVKRPFEEFAIDAEANGVGNNVSHIEFSENGTKTAIVVEKNLYMCFNSAQDAKDAAAKAGKEPRLDRRGKPKYDFVMWSTQTGPPGKSDGDRGYQTSFSPDSQFLISGHHDCSVRCYNAEDGAEVCKWTEHPDVPECCRFDPRRAMVATACGNIALRLPSYH